MWFKIGESILPPSVASVVECCLAVAGILVTFFLSCPARSGGRGWRSRPLRSVSARPGGRMCGGCLPYCCGTLAGSASEERDGIGYGESHPGCGNSF